MNEQTSTHLRRAQLHKPQGELMAKACTSRAGISLCINTEIPRHASSAWKHIWVFTCGHALLPLKGFPSKPTMKPQENLIWELLESTSLRSLLSSNIFPVFIKHLLCARLFPHSSRKMCIIAHGNMKCPFPREAIPDQIVKRHTYMHPHAHTPTLPPNTPHRLNPAHQCTHPRLTRSHLTLSTLFCGFVFL